MVMHILVNFDLNGTIIAGDEKGGKSPNKSILTDMLENYLIANQDAFVAAIKVNPLNELLNQQLNSKINLATIIQEHKHEFNHNNFFDNFKILVSLCLTQSGVNIKHNELVKYFLQTEKNADNSLKSMMIEQVLADETLAQQIKTKVADFHEHIDEEHIIKEFYSYCQSIQHQSNVHVVLNTFGNEAPKVAEKVNKYLPYGGHFTIVESQHAEYKAKTAQHIFDNAVKNRLIIQESNFHEYDTNGRQNIHGKLFPINTSKQGLYVFFDDNLSFGGLQEKGCVNIYDVASSKDIDFTQQQNLTSKNEIPEIKAVVCGKAIVVLVRARLSKSCEKDFFANTINRYQAIAETYYQQQQPKIESIEDRNRLFSSESTDSNNDCSIDYNPIFKHK